MCLQRGQNRVCCPGHVCHQAMQARNGRETVLGSIKAHTLQVPKRHLDFRKGKKKKSCQPRTWIQRISQPPTPNPQPPTLFFFLLFFSFFLPSRAQVVTIHEKPRTRTLTIIRRTLTTSNGRGWPSVIPLFFLPLVTKAHPSGGLRRITIDMRKHLPMGSTSCLPRHKRKDWLATQAIPHGLPSSLACLERWDGSTGKGSEARLRSLSSNLCPS